MTRFTPRRWARTALAVTVVGLMVATAVPVLASGDATTRMVTRVVLTGDEEVPPVDTDAKALFLFTFDDDSLRFRLRFNRHLDGFTQAHIHLGPAGTNGPVVAFLAGPFDPAIDPGRMQFRGSITVEDLLGPLAGDFDGFLDALATGDLYVNAHTVEYPAGEVRAQLPPSGEPPTATTSSTTTSTTTSTTSTTSTTTTTTSTTTTTTMPGGQTHNVQVGDGGATNAFIPDTLDIAVGDTVVWTNVPGVAHNVVWEDGTPGSGAPSADAWTYQRTFDQAGTFEYFCEVHVGLGMTGSVTVG